MFEANLSTSKFCTMLFLLYASHVIEIYDYSVFEYNFCVVDIKKSCIF